MGEKLLEKKFLTARWEHLVMINYEIDPNLLKPHVPPGTELDLFQGQCLVSLVGFNFLKTRVKGFAIPFHCNFEEVNLRFYVRRQVEGEWRRGVVFIKEIVPRWVIAWVARKFYQENYVAQPMGHEIQLSGPEPRERYEWRYKNKLHFLEVLIQGDPQPLIPGSLEEFITEHYWGYNLLRDGSTMEYPVYHPPWKVWPAKQAAMEIDINSLYGSEFQTACSQSHHSALLAEGSEIAVGPGIKL